MSAPLNAPQAPLRLFLPQPHREECFASLDELADRVAALLGGRRLTLQPVKIDHSDHPGSLSGALVRGYTAAGVPEYIAAVVPTGHTFQVLRDAIERQAKRAA